MEVDLETEEVGKVREEVRVGEETGEQERVGEEKGRQGRVGGEMEEEETEKVGEEIVVVVRETGDVCPCPFPCLEG